MSPAPSLEPLRKVHLNLFAIDITYLERRYGRGWTEVVRDLVRKHVNTANSTYTSENQDANNQSIP